MERTALKFLEIFVFDSLTLSSSIALCLAAVNVILVLLLVFRPKTNGAAAASDLDGLKREVQSKDQALREAWKTGDKFEALAVERKSEIDRMLRLQAETRQKMETDLKHQQELSNEISRLETQLKNERAATAEKIDMLTKVRESMESKFRELAQEALKVQGEAFSKSNVERLTATLAPLKEHVGLFEKELKQVHKSTIEERAALREQIESLTKRSDEIASEANALTRALKSDQQRQGAWGEMILASILERSGLREGQEYQTQAHQVGAQGERLRPDVIVRMPGDQSLVIDSKVSLVAYTDAVNAETPEDYESAQKRHLASLRGHINGLASKGYQNVDGSMVDYVILFVPIEGALAEALRADGGLTEYALERNITIATPTTLMMALRTVSNVWAVERRNQNAEEIAQRAGRLYDKVVGFVDNLEKVGRSLGQAQDAYDNAFGQLSRGRGNVLSQVETLKSLGAKTSKQLETSFENDVSALEQPDP